MFFLFILIQTKTNNYFYQINGCANRKTLESVLNSSASTAPQVIVSPIDQRLRAPNAVTDRYLN